MERMYLIGADEYNAMKNKSTSPKTEKQPKDVELALLHDDMTRKSNKKTIKKEKSAKEFSEKLKPLLQFNSEELNRMLKNFSDEKKSSAKFIITVLSRLPTVALTSEQMLINGQPVKEDVTKIVTEMIENNVNDVPSLIAKLREKKKDVKQKPKLISYDDDDDDDETDDEEYVSPFEDEIKNLTKTSTPNTKKNKQELDVYKRPLIESPAASPIGRTRLETKKLKRNQSALKKTLKSLSQLRRERVQRVQNASKAAARRAPENAWISY